MIKNYTQKASSLFWICFVLLALGFKQTKATQLSGTYTIDSAGTPSATVFKDFNSAIIYMTSAGTRPDGGPANASPFGVNGAVVFNVMQGTYTEQVNIPAITGASATNTITFDGGVFNASTRILTFNASGTTNAHTLRFNSCSWVSVRNITIIAQNAVAGIGVHFFGPTTTNNSVVHCRILVAQTTNTGVRGIMATNSNISSTGGGCSGSSTTISNITIDSNYIFGGQTAIFLSSSNSSGGPFNFIVRKNFIENCSSVGIGASTTQGYLYHDNYIKMVPNITTSIGIQHCNGSTSGIMQYVVTQNIIENAGQYGIRFQSNNANTSVTAPTVVANNYIKGTFSNNSCFGIDFSQGRNHKVYNNTIIMNMAGGTGINLGTSANANCAVKNNIIMLSANNSTGLCINSGGNNIDSADYNVYIKNHPDPAVNLVNLRGTTFTKLNFKGGLGLNFNSTLDDPLLQSDTLPVPGNICQKGENLWYVNTDIFGNTRAIPPQIGCAEGSGGVTTDVSVQEIIQPQSYPVVSGLQDVKVTIKNNGIANLTFASVSVQLGSITNTISYSGNLPACMMDTVTFSGINGLTLGTGSNTIRAWVNHPLDTLRNNDTVQKTFCTPLAVGVYTIDTGVTGDFHSFSEVANVLNCGGVSGTGTMVFNVARGVYTDQLSLGAINGLSPNTNIVFQSADNNADSAELVYNATAAGDNFVVKLASTNYVTFKNLTFRAIGSSFGRVFELTGNISYDSITNCKLIMPAINTTSTNFAAIWANPVTGKLNVVTNNSITGGAYGIYWFGVATNNVSDSNNISFNQFDNQYYMACYTSFVNNIKILRNTITPNTGFTLFYGIYVASSNFVEVANNSISPWNGGYGYFFSSVSGTSQNPSRLYNNTLAGGLTGTSYGLYLSSTTFTEVYHNTIYLTGTATTSYAGYFVLTGTTNTSTIIRNNILANLGTGSSNYAMYAWGIPNVNSDYNNLFTRGPNLVQAASPAATFANISIWRAASSFEKNSVSYLPGLTSNTSAVPNVSDSSSWSINGHGTYLPAYYQLDFNNNARPLNALAGAPDLGAMEFTPTSIAPLATFNPATLAPDSTTSFIFAGDTVAIIKWSQFGTPPTSGLEVRRYSGVYPLASNASLGRMNFYTTIWGPFGSALHDLTIPFKEMWIGNIVTKSSIRLARKDTFNFSIWQNYTGTNSTIDTINNKISTSTLFDFNFMYTGTDNLNPLPVKLGEFNANHKNTFIALNWNTLSEKNSDKFVVERSFNGKEFNPVGTVKSVGNSNTMQSYSFNDFDLKGITSNMVYYRLKMVDRDNSFEFSGVAVVKLKDQMVALFPNPFNNEISVELMSTQNNQVNIKIFDITGANVYDRQYQLNLNNNLININDLGYLNPGVYFIEVSNNGETFKQKLIKQ